MDRRGVLRLGNESEAESEPPTRAAMLICQDSTGGGQQPRQRGLWFWQAVDAAPRNRKGLGHRVLGIRLARGTTQGERQDGAVVLLEGSFEARDVSAGHKRGTNRRRGEFPKLRAIGRRSCSGCAR